MSETGIHADSGAYALQLLYVLMYHYVWKREREFVCVCVFSGAYFAFCAAPLVMTAMQGHNSVVVQRSVASYTNCKCTFNYSHQHKLAHIYIWCNINTRQRVVTLQT